MSCWIKLSVQSLQQIQLDFVADEPETQIRIVSGGTDVRREVGTSWEYLRGYLS